MKTFLLSLCFSVVAPAQGAPVQRIPQPYTGVVALFRAYPQLTKALTQVAQRVVGVTFSSADSSARSRPTAA